MNEFAQAGYRVVRDLLPDPARSFVNEYVLKAARSGQLATDDDDVPNTPYRYADPFMESLMKILLPRIAEESGLRLYPTYSYFRVYKHGDVLRAHRDRPSCEVSVTISLGYEAEKAWPIWIEKDGVVSGIELEPGDGLLYRGIDLRHWRESFAGTRATQVFLHYVDQDGPHRDWKFDRRADLGTSAAAERMMDMLMRGPSR